MTEELSSDQGRYSYAYEFEHYMQRYNRDLRRRRNTYGWQLDRRASWLGRVRAWVADRENPADRVIVDEDVPIEGRVGGAVDATVRAPEPGKRLLEPYRR